MGRACRSLWWTRRGTQNGDTVERIGVGRARARAGEADLLLWLSVGGAAPPPDVGTDERRDVADRGEGR